MARQVTSRLSRRQMLKGAALVLGSLSGSAILAACGGGGRAAKHAEPAKPAEAAKPAAPAAAAKPASAPAAAAKPAAGTTVVTIRDHDWIQGTPGQPNDWYDKFIGDWEKANPTIKIEREWFPRLEMHAKQLALAATGQIGDTVRINVAPTTAELYLKKVVHDLDSLWKDDKEWLDKDQKQFWPGNIKTYTLGGKVWGLPVVGHPGNVNYYINKTMVEKAGLKMPPNDANWTFEEMTALAKGLTQSAGGRTTVYGILPGFRTASANEYIVGMLRSFGGDLFDAEGKKCLLNTPESIKGLQVIADLYASGSAYPWSADLGTIRTDLFVGQKVAINVNTSSSAARGGYPALISKSPAPFEMI